MRSYDNNSTLNDRDHSAKLHRWIVVEFCCKGTSYLLPAEAVDELSRPLIPLSKVLIEKSARRILQEIR